MRDPDWTQEKQSASDQRIIDALDRIDADAFASRRHLPFASSLPHLKPGVRKRIPQSARQRMMDDLGGGVWRPIIIHNLTQAGLLPRRKS